MNIVEKQAEEFYDYRFLESGIYPSLENIIDSLDKGLVVFYKDKDKLDFFGLVYPE